MARHDANIDIVALDLALQVVGGRWKTLILAYLHEQPLRFAALRRAIGERISEKVLAQQLRELERHGMVSRRVEDTKPPQVEYAMTEHAHTLCHAVQQLAIWGAQHRASLAARDVPCQEEQSKDELATRAANQDAP
ncbi:MAG: helix-turn-helix transcriptional regulator [Planctomycetes bacterium]|nr:helix-turn-helix transcriptional regulator [Planctomycetota bacterium]